MSEQISDFYDELADEYDLMFQDWHGSIARQAAVLKTILERECGPAASVRVLDCACGIGTQALGLASLGFRLTCADISSCAIARARIEMSALGLECSFHLADMRELSYVPETGFDAVICMDNALPHLLCEEHLAQAADAVRAKLRPGGIFIASIRDYDRLVEERPVVQGPEFFSDSERRRIVFQLWDWIDERRYQFHLYITRDTPEGWKTHHGASAYRSVLRDELTSVLENAGFVKVRWMLPNESGFYQPLVIGYSQMVA